MAASSSDLTLHIRSVDKEFNDFLKEFVSCYIGKYFQIKTIKNTVDWIAAARTVKEKKARKLAFLKEMQLLCGFFQNFIDESCNGLLIDAILKTPASEDIDPPTRLDIVKVAWSQTNPNKLIYFPHKHASYHATLIDSYITEKSVKNVYKLFADLAMPDKLEACTYIFVNAAFGYKMLQDFIDSIEKKSSARKKFPTQIEFDDAYFGKSLTSLREKITAATLLERAPVVTEEIKTPTTLEFKILSKCGVYQECFNNDYIYAELQKIEKIIDAEEKKRLIVKVYKNIQAAAVFIMNMVDDIADGRLRANLLAVSRSPDINPLKELNTLEFRISNDFIQEPRDYIVCDDSAAQKALYEIIVNYLDLRIVNNMAGSSLSSTMTEKFKEMSIIYLQALFIHRNFDNPICQLEGKPLLHQKIYYIFQAFFTEFVGPKEDFEKKVKKAAEKNTLAAEKNLTTPQALREYNLKKVSPKIAAKARIKLYLQILAKENQNNLQAVNAVLTKEEKDLQKLEDVVRGMMHSTKDAMRKLRELGSQAKKSTQTVNTTTTNTEDDSKKRTAALKEQTIALALEQVKADNSSLHDLYDAVLMHKHLGRVANRALKKEILEKQDAIFVTLQAEIDGLANKSQDELPAKILEAQLKVNSFINEIKPRLTGLNNKLAAEQQQVLKTAHEKSKKSLDKKNKALASKPNPLKKAVATNVNLQATNPLTPVTPVLSRSVSASSVTVVLPRISSPVSPPSQSSADLQLERTASTVSDSSASGVSLSPQPVSSPEVSQVSPVDTIENVKFTLVDTAATASGVSSSPEPLSSPKASEIIPVVSMEQTEFILAHTATSSSSSTVAAVLISNAELVKYVNVHFQEVRQLLDLHGHNPATLHYALLYHFSQSFKLLNLANGLAEFPGIGDAAAESVAEFAAIFDLTNGKIASVYAVLNEFNAAIIANKPKINACKLILSTYLPAIKSILQPLHRVNPADMLENPAGFLKKFSMELQALSMLTTICGELEIEHACVESNFRKFLDFCQAHSKQSVLAGLNDPAHFLQFLIQLEAALAFNEQHSLAITNYIANNAIITPTGIQFFGATPKFPGTDISEPTHQNRRMRKN